MFSDQITRPTGGDRRSPKKETPLTNVIGKVTMLM
jgi:hypothetical protein